MLLLEAKDPNFKPKSKSQIEADLESMHTDVKDSVDAIIQVVSSSKNDDLLKATVEAFSMPSYKVTTLEDLHKFMKTNIHGGKYKGKAMQSVLIRELQGVVVNSVLSGGKTPTRAIIGTQLGIVSRSVSQTLGSGDAHVLTGDTATLKASASSTMAMVNLIPESFRVFRENLNHRFSNDVATIRTRFFKYDKFEQKHQLMKDWVEKNGSNSDKAVFRAYDVARTSNNNRFLTYSARIMGAADDTAKWVLGRMRAQKSN